MQALKLNPDLVYLESDDELLPGDLLKGDEAPEGLQVPTEIISIDEAALDIGDMDYDRAEKLAKDIKERIKREIGLPCTIGVSVGKVYAKMICDDSKPNGIGILKGQRPKVLPRGQGHKGFVGSRQEDGQQAQGAQDKHDRRTGKAGPQRAVENFGEFGKELFLLANGMDNSRIIENYTILSIGRERTFSRNTKDIMDIEKMAELSKEVMEEIKKNGVWFRGISVKARYSDFTERIKNKKLSNYTDSFETLYSTSMQLIKELLKGKSVRKIGVRTFDLRRRRARGAYLV